MKFIPLLLLFTIQLVQARNVTHLAESDVDYFRAVNSNSGYSNSSEALFLLMIFEASSGGGTAESSPHKTYVPLNDQSANLTDAEKQLENNVLSNSVTSLPGVTAADNLEVILRTLISVDEDSTSTEIHVLMENNSGNWSKLELETAVTYDGEARNWRLTIDLNTVCTEISTTECENIKNNSESGKEEIVSFYVLSSTGTFNLGQEYDPATYTGGIFYDVYLSDKVPTGNLTLTNLERGDGRLTITVSGGSSITNMTDPIIFRSYVFDGATGSTEVQSAGGTTIQTDSPVRDGDIVVKESFQWDNLHIINRSSE